MECFGANVQLLMMCCVALSVTKTWQGLHASDVCCLQVLIVHGSRDRLVPLSNSRRLAALVPNTQLVELQDCGHTPQEELPSQFIVAVKTYMAALQ